MDYLLQFWIILCCTFLVLEAATPSLFYFFSGAVGSFVSIMLYATGFEFTGQAVGFIIGSITSLIMMHYLLKHHPAFKASSDQKSNVFALVGKRAIVITTIRPPARGYVKINAESWSAENIGDEILEKGTTVQVVSVSGSHVKVKTVSSMKGSL